MLFAKSPLYFWISLAFYCFTLRVFSSLHKSYIYGVIVGIGRGVVEFRMPLSELCIIWISTWLDLSNSICQRD